MLLLLLFMSTCVIFSISSVDACIAAPVRRCNAVVSVPTFEQALRSHISLSGGSVFFDTTLLEWLADITGCLPALKELRTQTDSSGRLVVRQNSEMTGAGNQEHCNAACREYHGALYEIAELIVKVFETIQSINQEKKEIIPLLFSPQMKALIFALEETSIRPFSDSLFFSEELGESKSDISMILEFVCNAIRKSQRRMPLILWRQERVGKTYAAADDGLRLLVAGRGASW